MICSRFFGSSGLVFVIIAACIFFHGVLGRKCVCTSKACRESGAKTCRTRFSCYTELIYDVGGETRTTRGCTEGATPLLCESSSWQQQQHAWPRLSCCDDHDYCNAADEDFEGLVDGPTGKVSADEPQPSGATADRELQPARVSLVAGAGAIGLHQRALDSLHVAALLLAVAALISVFAACYVVTRFLNASGGSGRPRIIGQYDNQLDF